MDRKILTCLILSLSQITFCIFITFIYKMNIVNFQYPAPKSVLAERQEHSVHGIESWKTAVKRSTHVHLKDAVAPNKSWKTGLKLIVAIVTAPTRADRREGIRRTWMTDCSRNDVLCRFFTDRLSDLEPNLKDAIVQESLRYGDIEFMPIPRGYNFGARILWILNWSTGNYDFDFFLRIDDDYFLCLKRLLAEIPHRIHIPRLYWGHIHCVTEGQVRVDEGFLILSYDIAKEFAAKRDQLLCHPFGDQTVAMWFNNRTDVTRFHDPRVIHEVTARNPEFKAVKNLCATYLSLHGSYVHDNLMYWDIVKNENNRYWVPSIQPFEQVCKLGTYFDWRKMGGPPYTWEPKPCAMNPVWQIGNTMHVGRNMK